jgi:hypothetical protein
MRVLLLIRSITSTTWGHEAWPVELNASLIAMRAVLDATAVCALTVFRWLVP